MLTNYWIMVLTLIISNIIWTGPGHWSGCGTMQWRAIPPNVLAECGDIELYNWSKCDLSDPKVKTRIEDMFCQTDYIDGLDHIDCKVFK